MKVYVFKLTTGDDIIGVLENSPLTNDEYYNIIDPMNIVGARDDSGSMGMRLRDTLLLGSDNMLTIGNKNVLTYYEPIPQLANYYKRAYEYAKRFTKPIITEQIEMATKELEQDILEEEEQSEKLVDVLRRMSGSTLQ